MSIDEDGSLNYDEYQILMFRATLQDDWSKKFNLKGFSFQS
jgi:hypothetical protein